MRNRKRALYSRLYVGLLSAALLAELEEAAEALRVALTENDQRNSGAESKAASQA
ncbi:hypothetical protein [Noviherbaspirillum saxi]|uniref:hypothetical protein n=1 Tax=Noviherbaspirillum saxi TaxID=2320863 RepID=UPI001314831C|nr:hypothetical protein [Noviherbaspirillum saxi]